MTEIVLLLSLPVAVYFGWWLARTIGRRTSSKQRQLFSNQYFQGLNYLLNEQPDKAIQVFLELAEVNEDTVETHMALGSLFRRRGEVDRAIRFHQNIIAKPGLGAEQRIQALLELGEDYMKAGLLDRAERLFTELIENDAQTPSALHSLLEIYQQERDWDQALEVAQRLEQSSGEHMGDTMAQFCCEMANSALNEGDRERARRHLRQARRHDPRCIRARFILARVCRQEGEVDKALDLFEEIGGLDKEYIPELLEEYIETAEEAGQQDRSRARLEEWSEDYRGISLILKLADHLGEEQGGDAAGRFLVDTLTAKPSVRGLDRLIELKADGHLRADDSDDILKAVTARLLARQPAYRCVHCGFSGQSHHWQCPSCRHWSTTKKIQGVLGE
ncbi:MAG: lipopolysaccharide assembly protein LapB [Xanthomonadales bacterium]|nr:lipopolysaccharide assembly protein LapB [Gammaproteobacteria bacterium]MBT8051235.1 lipopolysaccharide assembly protein LapB [Gammaproteobacteria bacterium]MBT8056627.1 lipopolysaccharide assembly protein LapB [Gammaproteobacteria bacterium]NNJ79352.1 lipopolysaccharide assembly protein LapB [Xanthomonadales bacterium]NNL03889.1 lipopolysaccharide assembly protein LapB [Xanthomonadales bacterium]